MTAELNEDFVDMIGALLHEGVEFVLVGAYALAAHGLPRATGDIDFLVRPTPENAARVMNALLRFGAPVVAHGVTQADFERPDNVYQVGLPPRRIDLLTSISGVDFDEANAAVIEVDLAHHRVPVIGRDALLKNKRASGRPKDLVDAAELERHEPGGR